VTSAMPPPAPGSTAPHSIGQFRDAIVALTRQLAGRPLDADLDRWLNAGSAHRPTVAQRRALVLYLLPEGRIDFTR
jgi:hypothetical protein